MLALGARAPRDYHAADGVDGLPEPGSALNPGMRVGAQVAEAFTVLGARAKEATRPGS